MDERRITADDSGGTRESRGGPAIRQQVLVNPNAAIRAIAGKALPEGMSVQVVEAADVTIVLPPLQTGALSDQDLITWREGLSRRRRYVRLKKSMG